MHLKIRQICFTWQGVAAGRVPSAYSRLLFLPAQVHHSHSKTDITAKSRIGSALWLGLV